MFLLFLYFSGILKAQTEERDPEIKGILKSSPPQDEKSTGKGISKPHGILKKETSMEKSEAHGILKRERSFETKIEPTKGVLKKESSFEVPKLEPEKGVLKKETPSETKEVKRILKEPIELEQPNKDDKDGILKIPRLAKEPVKESVKEIQTTPSRKSVDSIRASRQKQLAQRVQDSSTEDESPDKVLKIKNEAIARRRRMMEMRKAAGER